MKKCIITIFLFFITLMINAQETIPVTGNDAIGSGGSTNYTVGQLLYTTNNGSGSVAQGIQQSIELFTLSNPELTTVALTAVTYPNPTTNHVTLAISDLLLDNLNCILYTQDGKTITTKNIHQEKTKINLNNLASGVYILKVNQNNTELKTFKIIKH